jgi:hypothetical protein
VKVVWPVTGRPELQTVELWKVQTLPQTQVQNMPALQTLVCHVRDSVESSHRCWQIILHCDGASAQDLGGYLNACYQGYAALDSLMFDESESGGLASLP